MKPRERKAETAGERQSTKFGSVHGICAALLIMSQPTRLPILMGGGRRQWASCSGVRTRGCLCCGDYLQC